LKKRTVLIFFTLILLVLSIAALPVMAAPKPSGPTITWTNAPQNNVIYLHVGESYTLNLQVTSATKFASATAKPDTQFPGKGIFYSGTDRATNATSATLHLTMTGKQPTDSLPGGYVPASAFVGVKYGNGNTVVKQFDFQVVVTP